MNQDQYEYRGLIASSWDFLRGDPEKFEDRLFFLEVVRKFGEPALDVGCGTGRLLLELRSKGADIDGLDCSPDMLGICREKADELGLEVSLYAQKMETMDLPRRYKTVIIPSSSFQLIPDLTDATRALERLHDHLLPGGALVFSIWSIKDGWDGKWNDWGLVAEKDGFDDGIGIRRWGRSMHDPTTQLRHTESRYELVMGDEVIYAELHRQSPEFRNYKLDQILEMMRAAGFDSLQALSGFSFDSASIEDGVFCVLGVKT
jgi:ubiquinone/menaquinone biosynthesis C-methylase UbiE